MLDMKLPVDRSTLPNLTTMNDIDTFRGLMLIPIGLLSYVIGWKYNCNISRVLGAWMLVIGVLFTITIFSA